MDTKTTKQDLIARRDGDGGADAFMTTDGYYVCKGCAAQVYGNGATLGDGLGMVYLEEHGGVPNPNVCDLCWPEWSRIRVGSRVELTSAADRYPHALVSAGERGTVTECDGSEVSVLMDNHHPGLTSWGNCLMWYPDSCGDEPWADLKLASWDEDVAEVERAVREALNVCDDSLTVDAGEDSRDDWRRWAEIVYRGVTYWIGSQHEIGQWVVGWHPHAQAPVDLSEERSFKGLPDAIGYLTRLVAGHKARRIAMVEMVRDVTGDHQRASDLCDLENYRTGALQIADEVVQMDGLTENTRNKVYVFAVALEAALAGAQAQRRDPKFGDLIPDAPDA